MSNFNYTPDQEAWLQDLEKTRAKQTEGYLHNSEGWCCLGRACKVLDIDTNRHVPTTQVTEWSNKFWEFDGEGQELPPKAVKALRLRDNTGTFLRQYNGYRGLTYMNDNGWSFKRIAAYIRANPKNVFIEQRKKL